MDKYFIFMIIIGFIAILLVSIVLLGDFMALESNNSSDITLSLGKVDSRLYFYQSLIKQNWYRNITLSQINQCKIFQDEFPNAQKLNIGDYIYTSITLSDQNCITNALNTANGYNLLYYEGDYFEINFLVS